ncbi:hypothetical protein A2303_00290 [Candidatus Falkowbacteria bacterium RIFOXYB2_FULL_47_14]|uniref:Uncharacterized protein n=1 Tax=Candidatus Falkowbacteria bacterium RIFOXYA2_FULL_47_19 TaxID=1797994 RepID=A0A1F5SNU3_9BACT|nr:MAG: hypothetical protein A2227_05435 [Candidatus Falkowbacteria bacterium RIFOXYA2_FULL_47_19]OGF36481.1 MAG: hypothetical protein A2468_04925 [Candidatus Falkowbacteria bacterium RIFOXYC2_FULL_46_15]OGF42997.1 MAG: hypothetical protein A2303_00290 [Candidatus Falkowbacteria bacterium RIFOXYB2_FULL_47_14]
MKLLGKKLKKLKDFISPPEPEYYRYLYSAPGGKGFNRLFSGQVKHIIDVVNEELARSREFGLVLRPEDEKKEKLALLSLLDHWAQALIKMGRENSIAEQEVVLKGLIATMFKIMNDQTEYYHEYFFRLEEETCKPQVKNKYNCHLESVTSRLVNDFLNGKVPLKE